MSNNFVPTLWAEKMLREMDAVACLVKNSTTKYNGNINQKGDTVVINSINAPTIGDYVPGTTTITPEQIKGESTILQIDQSKMFSFLYDDVDGKQGISGVLEEAMRKAAQALNDTAEKHVASLYVNAGHVETQASLTSINVLSTLLKAKTKLYEANVTDNTEVVLEVTPDVWQKMVLADIIYTTDGKTLRSGVYSPVLGMKVFISNNLKKTGAVNHCIMRTKEAIAFAEQINKVEKFRPENAFADAVKGLHLYGAKVIKPKEMAVLNLTTAAEKGI